MYVCTYIYIYMYEDKFSNMYVQIYMCIYIYKQVHMCVHIKHVCMCIYNIYIHILSDMYACQHAWTQACMSVWMTDPNE